MKTLLILLALALVLGVMLGIVYSPISGVIAGGVFLVFFLPRWFAERRYGRFKK